ncbi:hypothetical protein D9M69_602070 [compost metagenome]
MTSGERPLPVSCTENSMALCPSITLGSTRSSTLRRASGRSAMSMDSAAFFSRLTITCSMRMGSTRTTGSRAATLWFRRTLRRRSSMPASSTASLTMVATSAGVRLGSLRFTKERMRWMIWPARCACFEVFSSAASRASLSIVWPLMRDIIPLQ